MNNDSNDSSWMRTMTAVLCAVVAIGLYKEVPRIVDSVRQKLSAKEQPCKCGKIECEKFATSDQFEGLGIKRGCKAFSVCGNVMAEASRFSSGVISRNVSRSLDITS